MYSRRLRRRPVIDLSRITIGDYIVLVAGLATVISLFLPWFVSTIGQRSEHAFAYSEVASVVVILFFLISLFLILYPALSPELGLPPLPFATPVPLLGFGFLL